MAAIDRVLEKYCHLGEGGLHCAAFFAVDKNGDTIYERAIGHRNLEQTAKLDMNDVFWTGSLSKLMGAIASMIAVEKGYLTLDTDLRGVIPFFKNVEILRGFDDSGAPVLEKLTAPITLRHCLTHSNGFAYDMMDQDLQRWAKYTGKKETGFGGSMKGYEFPLLYKPGENWKYGPGMDFAGQAIEILTGMTLEEFMREYIWDKLGMTSTTFFPLRHEEINNRRVQVASRENHTAPNPGGLKPGKAPYSLDVTECCSGVGIYSSPADIRKLLAAIARGGAPILKPGSLNEMLTPQLADPSHFLNVVGEIFYGNLGQQWPRGVKGNFGLGGNILLEDVPGRRRKGTTSWQGMAGIFSFYDRETGVAAGFMTQVLPPGDPVARECMLEAERALYATLNPQITSSPALPTEIKTNGTHVNGTYVNGTYAKGTHVNGAHTNGVHVNGDKHAVRPEKQQLLCLNILGYRKQGMDVEAFRKYMTEVHAPLVSGLMVKYGFVRYSMVHTSDETRALMGQIYDPDFSNIAQEDVVVQIVFPNIESFVRFKSDPYFQGKIGPDHANFADVKRGRMTIGWVTEIIENGKIIPA